MADIGGVVSETPEPGLAIGTGACIRFGMSKRFLTDVIQQSTSMTGVASGRLAAELVAAIKAEIVENGRFTLPDFGSFTVRETPKRSALNPKTGEKIAVKAGATVRFKVSPTLKAEALAGLKKSRRKAAKAG